MSNKNILLACETIKEDVQDAIEKMQIDIPTVFIESSLHNDPAKLNKRLTEEILYIHEVDNILLGFGFCGNAVCGIKSFNKTIILPRVDDCITLFLGSIKRRKEIGSSRAYFLTSGMLNNKENIWAEYKRCLKKYGREKGNRIMRSMLAHYKKLIAIETPADKENGWLRKVDVIASDLGLEKMTVQGSNLLIKKLLMGEWDKDFIVLKPGQEIEIGMLFDSNLNQTHQ